MTYPDHPEQTKNNFYQNTNISDQWPNNFFKFNFSYQLKRIPVTILLMIFRLSPLDGIDDIPNISTYTDDTNAVATK